MKYFLLFLSLCCVAPSGYTQSYDPTYIRNLKYRMLAGYLSETRDISIYLRPEKLISPDANEELLLKNSPNIFSGLMIQAENASYFWASTLPQSSADINRYGKQQSTMSRASYTGRQLTMVFNYVKNEGFYDYNYIKHPDFAGDTIRFRRHQGTMMEWIGGEMNYYPGGHRLCIGIPSYFGERQLKTGFTLGSRLVLNQVHLKNGNTSFFRDSLTGKHPELQVKRLQGHSLGFALTPALNLVCFKNMFCYLEASAGIGLNASKTANRSRGSMRARFELPQSKIAVGVNSDRFLLALYYTNINQTLRLNGFSMNAGLNNFGFIVGLRFNQPKYRYLKWDTL
jgi:hypothetical protein